MKQRISMTLLAAIIPAILTITPAFAVPIVSLNLLNSPVAVGDTFQVAVWADGDDIELELLSFGFDATLLNGGIFSYDGYSLGSGFDDFSDPLTFGNVTGDGFPGIADNDVLLATLTFTTLTLGTDTLNVMGIYDEMFYGLYYETPDFELTGYNIDASLTITTGINPVPEPSTVFLIGAGLLCFAGFRKKF